MKLSPKDQARLSVQTARQANHMAIHFAKTGQTIAREAAINMRKVCMKAARANLIQAMYVVMWYNACGQARVSERMTKERAETFFNSMLESQDAKLIPVNPL